MALQDVQKVSPTPQHLIVEYTSNESLLGSVLPSKKIGGVTVVNLQHVQVMRYVYTLVEAEEIFFEGRRLERMPGLSEFVTEWVKPGRQIVSRPTGRYSVLHAYTGKKNIVIGKVAQMKAASVQLRFIDLFGDDPAPDRVLYGNPRVPFVQRGETPPIAAAYYNSRSHRFEPIEAVRRETLLQDFMRRFAQASAAVG